METTTKRAATAAAVPVGHPPLPVPEFVALLATMISLTALSIDAMLPALPLIARDLGASGPNAGQYVVTSMLAGFSLGQLVYGPLSDSVGRKPTIYAGVAVFVFGGAIALWARSFETMLVGRVLQGLGAASLRVVTMALVRDQYVGDAMARIVALIMGVFVVVPAIAPALGQALIGWFDWHAIFVMLLVQAAVALVWFALRQPETLAVHARRPLSLAAMMRGALEVCRNRVAAGYSLAAGLVFGGIFGYLTSAQPIFQDLYGVGEAFPLYFAALALSLGAASVVNSRLVLRLGMRRLTRNALTCLCLLSGGYGAFMLATPALPPLWSLMAFFVPLFFCIGVMFGNFNALAMEPLGHLAGIGAAVVGSGSTLISLLVGGAIGQCYDQSPRPLVLGFAISGSLAWLVMGWVERGSASSSA